MIGILDSGLGGLSVLNEIQMLLPHESLIYFGDSAWCPYGTKTYPEIQERVSIIVDLLIERGAEIIVIACNSATIACVEHLRSVYPIPIIGMEPGVKPAAQITETGNIGVFATEASLAGEKFHRLLSSHAKGVKVITQPCPDFVTLVERGILEGLEVEKAIHQYMRPLIAENVDTVVLGCTHYPFLKMSLLKLYPNLKVIDTGQAVARQVQRKLHLSKEKLNTPHLIITSGKKEAIIQLIPTLSPLLQEYDLITHT